MNKSKALVNESSPEVFLQEGAPSPDRAKRDSDSRRSRRIVRTEGTLTAIALYTEYLRDTVFTTRKPMAITIQGQRLCDSYEQMHNLLRNYLLKTKATHYVGIIEYKTHYHCHGIIWRTENCVPRKDVLTYGCKVTTEHLSHLKTWIQYMFKESPTNINFIKTIDGKKYIAAKAFSNVRLTKLKILTKGINIKNGKSNSSSKKTPSVHKSNR